MNEKARSVNAAKNHIRECGLSMLRLYLDILLNENFTIYDLIDEWDPSNDRTLGIRSSIFTRYDTSPACLFFTYLIIPIINYLTATDVIQDDDGEIRGKITPKHLAVRWANDIYNKKLKIKDNDIADALAIATCGIIKEKTKIGYNINQRELIKALSS